MRKIESDTDQKEEVPIIVKLKLLARLGIVKSLGHKLSVHIQDELVNLEVAQQIYDLRQKAGLTQSEPAALTGTSHSVISRLEDAA